MKIFNIILTLAIGISASAQPAPTDIVKEINLFRKTQGLAPAILVQGQSQAAQLQADWISQTDLSGHIQTRAANGKPLLKAPWDRGNYVGVSVVAENIFTSHITFSAKDIVEGWINSPGHRTNMLYSVPPEIQCQIGVAVVPLKSNPNIIVIVMVIGDNIDHATGQIRH